MVRREREARNDSPNPYISPAKELMGDNPFARTGVGLLNVARYAATEHRVVFQGIHAHND